jgi:hypothetical protein
VNHGEALVVPQRLQRPEARVQPEIAVQVHDITRRYGDPGAFVVVQAVAMRHDHVQAVDGTALEETNEDGAGGRVGG